MSSKSEYTETATKQSMCARSLISLTGSRLVLAAIISFVIFTLLCFVENTNEAYFTRWYAKLEINSLLNNLVPDESGSISIKRGDDIAHYWADNANAYGFRIWDQSGTVIDASNLAIFDGVSPVAAHGQKMPDHWQRKIGEAWFDTLSGQRVVIAQRPLWIEVATRGDPDKLRYKALYRDFIEDVLTPVFPTFVIAISLSLFSLRRALRPVQSASRAARALDPTALNTQLHIPTDKLPREIEALAKAVNDLLERTEMLVHSQSEYIGRAAHQLKAPLGVMLLETEKIDDPRIGSLQNDLMHLGETVDRLLELARMQGAPPVECGQLEIASLADDVELELAALAEKHGAQIRVLDLGATPVCGDYVSMREALRNLVINAIVHHPDQATVELRCGPGPRFSVEDNGRGIAPENAAKLFEPFARLNTTCEGAGLGLAVAHKIVELHCGTIAVKKSDIGGAAFCVELVPFVGNTSNSEIALGGVGVTESEVFSAAAE